MSAALTAWADAVDDAVHRATPSKPLALPAPASPTMVTGITARFPPPKNNDGDSSAFYSPDRDIVQMPELPPVHAELGRDKDEPAS